MLYFLHGPDTYRLAQKLKEIEQQYAKVHGSDLNLQKVDAKAFSFKDFWDKLNQQSLFIKKKLFILENVFSSAGFKEDLTERAEQIAASSSIVVLIEKGEIKKTNKLFKLLDKKAKSQSFPFLQGQELRSWARKEFTKQAGAIESKALEKLLSSTKGDTWALSNEIKKLATYSKKITQEDIELFLGNKIEAEIFSTIDCLGQGNKEKALQLLESHLKKGDSPLYLLKMIAYQFRNLVLVKSCRADPACRQRLNLHPFVLRKATFLSSRFSSVALKDIFRKIFDTDCKIKQGIISPEQGLRQLIAEI